MGHLPFTLFAALIVAAALAMTGERSPRERLYSAIRVYAGCLAVVFAGSWLMYLIHR